ncbi:SUMF1/EgtB/PvdO family nonheme iron enzyme [Nioella nitratireducens]|uniref:SUMF1/EgtB/PvdO family nonheme iron enzyme n=1 Tax=Nioella nitratireducens TaxID=1287720 RepID=UPI0008FCEED6|nr:SUMF1/EgtB/PvdO family nonheme iron enzyme [Nioella nitratireducens]
MRYLTRACVALLIGVMSAGAGAAQSLQDLNEQMFRQMQQVRGVSAAEIARIRDIFAGSSYIGQGNPAVTRHPMTPEEAAARIGGSVANVQQSYRNSRWERICGGPYRAPLYDPATESPEDAEVCIDMFEYPNIPMVYPVTWVRASEAAALCAAEGGRIGDAHEWEGAAAGALLPPDYQFQLGSQQAMRAWHNAHWAFQSDLYSIGQWRSGVCATGSHKSAGCNGGSFTGCGSNTYPAGSFPQCHSPLGAYDIDGNAAEHMNLPLSEDQMASRGSTTLGVTEMKGSWFIWDTVRAHEHWARWRAPFWHGSQVLSPSSHRNYHLGFRCFHDVN